MHEVRFATVGTSAITEQFLRALTDVEGASYVAAYSRDASRARAFGEPFGATRFHDSLETLAADPEVDAVYVASPNGAHAAQALALVRAGKHVLVEKAFASNEREAAAVFAAARERGVVALEAMRNLHVPAFRAIEETAGELGQVWHASFGFSKVTSRIARLRAGERLNVFDPALAGGALMDIGVYCVEPAVALFGEPGSVSATAVTARVPGCREDDPCSTVDLSGQLVLSYPDKVVALTFGKVFDDVLPCEVAGERATLAWDQVSCPCNLRVYDHEDKGMVFRVEGAAGRPLEVEVPERDMACEARLFVSAVRGQKDALAARERFEGVTLASLRVMDEARRQMGVRFPADADA